MKHGKVEGAQLLPSIAHIQMTEYTRKNLYNVARDGVGKKWRVTLDFEGILDHTERPGVFVFTPEGAADLFIEQWFPPKTGVQHSTFWGICRFIAWVQEGRKPNDRETYWVREGIIGECSPWMENPATGIREPLRPSDPRMDTKVMSRIINAALNKLAEQDVPTEVEEAIGKDIRRLWTEFYKWRYEKKADPVDEEITTWEEYRAAHPVCEATGQLGTDGDPLERAHIVSVGADKANEEAPWNWLHIRHSVHMLQHQRGWSAVLTEYPHLKGKIEAAQSRFETEKTGELFDAEENQNAGWEELLF